MPVKEFRSKFKDGRTMITRISRIGEDNDRDFDIRFWQELSSKQRADAVWQMVEEYRRSKGKNPKELQLQNLLRGFEDTDSRNFLPCPSLKIPVSFEKNFGRD